jgi:hypothetical protein
MDLQRSCRSTLNVRDESRPRLGNYGSTSEFTPTAGAFRVPASNCPEAKEILVWLKIEAPESAEL